MKTKIFLLFLALGMGTMQMEAQGLFKQLKKAAKEIKQEKKGQEEESLETLLGGESSTSSKKSSQNTSQSPSQSSSEDEVTLVVSADGTTKDEATKVALRSAIEQAYGTFVSANTTILNDELVKDEIVTVASGNIKGYKEIASNVMPDGKTFVTLQATVCISKLVSYAQSKGAETEFAGATFGMNIKMKELNKQNEKKALDNLLIQIKQLASYAFTWNLNVQEPKFMNSWQDVSLLHFTYVYGDATYQENLKYNFQDPKGQFQYISTIDDFNPNAAVDLLGNFQNYYEMTLEIRISPNENTQKMANLITSTLNSLAMSEQEVEEYRKMNIPYSRLSLTTRDRGWILRSSNDDIEGFQQSFNSIINEASSNLKIVDNMNVESYFYPFEIAQYHSAENGKQFEQMNIKFPAIVFSGTEFLVHGTGIFQYARVKHRGNVLGIQGYFYPAFLDWVSGIGGDDPDFTVTFFMPKADISKYSNFRVERKQ